MQWLYFVAYAAIVVFTIAVVVRFLMWSRMPMHVRWELYPVAHEPGKASYGGSYLEESEWWNKPRETSLLGELKVMVPEILFLVALKEKNPKLWIRSLPFHFGLYLVIGCTGLLVVNGLLAALFDAWVGSGVQSLALWGARITGILGSVLALVGAIGLLQRRMSTPELRHYSSGADHFNLLFFIVTFGLALVGILVADRDLGSLVLFTQNLIGFHFASLGGSGMETFFSAATVLLLSLLVAYIPLTHMSHFVGKYFAYHAIRWNDTPNLKGGPQEKTIHELLSRPVSWAAPHIGADGKTTWADVATKEVEK